MKFETMMEEEEQEEEQDQRKKRTNNFYNLPRYFMMLILTLLSPENLDGLGVPRSIGSKLNRIVNRMREQGRKKHGAKSNFYNHSHYNCLFLQEKMPSEGTSCVSSIPTTATTASTRRSLKSRGKKDMIMVEEVFEFKEGKWNTFNVASVNTAKALIAEIVVT